MLSSAEILQSVLPVFLILLAGVLLHRLRILPRGSNAQLIGLVINLLLPCLIIDKLVGNPIIHRTGDLVWAAAIGAGMVCFGIAFSWVAGGVLGLERGSGRRTFSIASGLQNYGFMALPVLAAVFPGDGAMGTLFLHNLGVEIAVWTLGLMIMLGKFSASWKAFLNGPIIALALGIFLGLSGMGKMVPGPVDHAISLLGSTAIPLAMLTIGMTIDELFAETRPSLRVMGSASLLRLAILPVFMLAAARWLPITKELKQVIIVQAAMPSAVFPIMVARAYGGQPTVAIQVVVTTTLLALLTIPFVILWGSRFVFP